MKRLLFTLASLLPAVSLAAVFRLHLSLEPASVEPWAQKNSGGAYLLGQVYGTLLKFQDGQLIPSLAEKCEFKTPLRLVCTLKKNIKFSDDTPITAPDFEKSLKDYVSPENKAFRADLLFSVKNAEDFYTGKAARKDVGISAPDARTLIFELSHPDPEFTYNLTSPLLTVLKSAAPSFPEIHKWPTSGAYKFVSWESKKKITLQKRDDPNVQVEFVFLSEDTVALNLYRTGELQFLRRLPTLFIPQYRGKPDYFEVDQIRFDYIGFAPQLRDKKNLRQALVRALDFPEIDKILLTKGSYGCPGLPADSFEALPCLKFDLKEAKKFMLLAEKEKWPSNLKLGFSKQGGDDIKRTMEWAQSEWQKKLGLKVRLEQVENQIYVERIKSSVYPIFRKGLAPERPTCLSALETLSPGSNEDYLQIREPEYLKLLENLKSAVLKKSDYQKSCTAVVRYLIDNAHLIPTGPIYWSILASPKWTGWKLNSLNQLDLSDLHLR